MSGTLAGRQRQLQNAVMGAGDVSWPGLAIYHNAYRLRAIEALSSDYPMLSRWLGQERFSRLAQDYLAAHPSTHFSLRWFGRHLPDFLSRQGPPEWAEMASFEWALSLAFDCADAEPLSVGVLAGIPPQDWPGLKFRLHPGLTLLRLRYPVPPLWKQLQSENSPPQSLAAGHPVSWMIWRRGLKTYFRSLTDHEAVALASLLAGEPFAELCEALSGLDLPIDVVHQAALWLRKWLEEGVIVGVEAGGPLRKTP